jgi:singapore isolate B (sub-type 7) whole genome shotgun sequence assembly, scaffold_17
VKKVMRNDDLMLDIHIADKNWNCYNTVLEKYESTYGFNDYSLKYARTLANMCSMYNGNDADILNAM